MAKACVKVSQSNRAKAHVRCFTKKEKTNKTSEPKSKGLDSAPPIKKSDKQLRDELAGKIEKLGYQVRTADSEKDFGNSYYIMTSRDNFATPNEEVKIRISDHSVSNSGRVFNEVHINGEQEFDKALNKVKYFYDRDKYFDKKEVNVFMIQKKEVKQLTDNDKVLSKRITKKGEDIYEVERKVKSTSNAYFAKDSKELYLIMPPANWTENYDPWMLDND